MLLGNSGVGKTSLVCRWTTGAWQPSAKPTVGANHQRKPVMLDKTEVDIYLWDTAGQEQFEALTPLYARSACAALVVASIDDKDSFSSLQKWLDLLSNSCDQLPPAILLVNKIDKSSDYQFSRDDIEDQYQQMFTAIYYVSAYSGECVDNAFIHAADLGYKFILSTSSKETVPIESKTNTSCC